MRSYSHLSEDERDQIGVLRAAGRSMGAIARALGRAKATIFAGPCTSSRDAQPMADWPPVHAQCLRGA
jgi:Helix-turn-helix domain